MSARRDEDELVEALKKIPAKERRRRLNELLERLDREGETLPIEKTQSGATEFEAGRRLTELRGLGKELWSGVDAQKYVDAERESWGG